MKFHLTFLSLAAITMFLLLQGCKEAPPPTPAPKPKPATVEELGQMNRDFAKALTAKDAAAAAILYDENASILPPNEPIVTGRANIQKYWENTIAAGLIDGSVKTIDAKSNGDLGYEIGSFQLRFKGEKGDTIVETGKYTEILKRDTATGKWISTYGMWSSNEAPPK